MRVLIIYICVRIWNVQKFDKFDRHRDIKSDLYNNGLVSLEAFANGRKRGVFYYSLSPPHPFSHLLNFPLINESSKILLGKNITRAQLLLIESENCQIHNW